MSQNLLITNCRLFNDVAKKQSISILIENGVITHIGQVNSDSIRCKAVNAHERILAPGFIDVHVQGAGGADVLDATPDALKMISATCASFGTTSFLATTVFKPDQLNHHLSLAAECTESDLGGARLLGIHLEGPFISPQKRGMIQPDCLCAPSPELMDKIQALTKDRLRIMTIAPELPGGLQLIGWLVNSKVIASFGHSNATYEQTIAGFNAGITHVTHLFNAMPSLHHRSPGPLTAIFQAEHVSAQLIPDGVHIHPAVLKLAFNNLGQNRIISITDGLQAMGLPDGNYIYNGIEYESKNGTAKYKDGTLIGTSFGLSQLVAKLMVITGCSLDTAVKTVTENPARLLGIADKKGSIGIGKDADLVLLDNDCSVHTTIVAGKIVFEK